MTLSYKAESYIVNIIDVIETECTTIHNDKEKWLAYEWSFRAKDVSLLIRDIMVGLLKMNVFHNQGMRSDQQLKVYAEESIALLLTVTSKLEDDYFKVLAPEIQLDWSHQINPSQLIAAQLHEIIDQVKRISRAEHKLQNIDESFKNFINAYDHYISNIKRSILNGNTALTDVVKSLESATEHGPNQTIQLIDQKVASLVKERATGDLNSIVLEDIDKLELPIGSKEGALVFKTIDVLSEVSSWTALHVTTDLNLADANTKVQNEKISSALVQVNNRLKAAISVSNIEDLEGVKSDLKTLKTILQGNVNAGWSNQLDIVQDRLKQHINTSMFFEENMNFLPTSSISVMSHSFFKRVGQKVVDFDIKSILFGNHNNIEASSQIGHNVSDVIEPLIGIDENSIRNAIFMRKGYLGTSFTVERVLQEVIMRNHFNDWLLGYGGGLCITGLEGSGRTTLLEKLPLMYPQTSSHHIIIGMPLEINRHKFTMTTDLLATLNNIKTYKEDQPVIVTIDDLDQYVHKPEEMFELFEAITDFMRNESDGIYLAIVLSRSLYQGLCIYFDMNEIFSAIINTDDNDHDTIRKALISRAQATTSAEVWDQQFHSIANRARDIAKHAKGNVGYAMQLWCIDDIYKYFPKLENTAMEKIVEKYQTQLKMLSTLYQVHLPTLLESFDIVAQEEFKRGIKVLINYKVIIENTSELIMIHPKLRYLVDFYLLQIQTSKV